ncbi:DUF3135 domain-containing protein [Geomesophilobacter sediminis]|uniref:DUF3135 domain-containing protein n=1 Tax=Geomesophilobacter sediminis TaxID=2798584 RepID=A0A8J7J7Y8_9BACT|nr:DUF3135 domain-containing protein [Geomesophilobacter sediminis]MBJ6725561.1 DUF3135 domain-containing protein [Geomesophilobacter sediminis]
MDTLTKKEFDSYSPDELSELYRTDPRRFRELADEAIDQACVGRTDAESIKLRQMQWRVEGLLRKGKSPLERLRIMEGIFYSEVFGDEGDLSQLVYNWEKVMRMFEGAPKPAKRACLYAVK